MREEGRERASLLHTFPIAIPALRNSTRAGFVRFIRSLSGLAVTQWDRRGNILQGNTLRVPTEIHRQKIITKKDFLGNCIFIPENFQTFLTMWDCGYECEPYHSSVSWTLVEWVAYFRWTLVNTACDTPWWYCYLKRWQYMSMYSASSVRLPNHVLCLLS